MLTFILGLLGIGGVAGIAVYLFGGATVVAFVSRMPKPVWYAIGAAAVLIGAGVYHSRQVASAYARGKADEAAHILQKAAALKAQTDALTTNISEALRSKSDAENSRIHDTADAIRLRGPGRAACPGNPGVPAAPSGPLQISGTSAAPVSKLPYPKWDDLLAVRFPPAVAFAEQGDLNRSEVLAWREWYRRESEAWPKPVPPVKKHRSLWQRITPW